MLRSLKAMMGYGIEATDGQIGRAHDFLFDDETWGVRYLVDDTGHWLPGRKVLIPVSVLTRIDWRNELFVVPHTREEIQNGPGIESNASVTRQMEHSLFDYFQWAPYWSSGGMIQPPPVAVIPGTTATEPVAPELVNTQHPPVQEHHSADPHLQSFNDVLSFHIQHGQDDLGRVTDFIFDDEDWEVESVIFDTGHWLRGKRIQAPMDRVLGIFPDEGKVTVDITKEETEKCPSFNIMKLAQDQLNPEDNQVHMTLGDVTDEHVKHV